MAHRENIRAVPADVNRGPADDGPEREEMFEAGDLDERTLAAARRLARAHMEIAAELAPDSPVRALALRCGGHWARLGGLPHRGLRPMSRR